MADTPQSPAPQELEAFFDFLRIPSVSARPQHSSDVRACAEWLRALLASWTLDAQIHETGGAPVVIARSVFESSKPTVLLYDVQPAEPLDLWKNPPFEPEVRDGYVFARGATDNKGQTFSHLIGLRRMLAERNLPANIIVLLEGEEEIGSPNLEKFLRENREALACDVVLISDTSMVEPGWPAITLGLRGVACFEILVTGPKSDLHSGIFGGPTPNPALALSRVLSELVDESGKIAIPGFYDDVEPVSEMELASWKILPWGEDWFEQTTGIFPGAGETGRSVLERAWSRPTAEINGLTSGHQGAGSKTIIPATASAKLSFRLVPGQNPDRLAPAVVEWFRERLARQGVEGAVTYDHGGMPFHCPPENPYIQATARALEKTFGRAAAFTREGLSIPVTSIFARELGVPVILAGLGLADCQAHAPNESYPLSHLELGAAFHRAVLAEYATIYSSMRV